MTEERGRADDGEGRRWRKVGKEMKEERRLRKVGSEMMEEIGRADDGGREMSEESEMVLRQNTFDICMSQCFADCANGD